LRSEGLEIGEQIRPIGVAESGAIVVAAIVVARLAYVVAEPDLGLLAGIAGRGDEAAPLGIEVLEAADEGRGTRLGRSEQVSKRRY
jgi:hypothetical protein